MRATVETTATSSGRFLAVGARGEVSGRHYGRTLRGEGTWASATFSMSSRAQARLFWRRYGGSGASHLRRGTEDATGARK